MRRISSRIATIAAMKAGLEVPVIASLNATSSGGWVRFARLIEEAGADALELDFKTDAPPGPDVADCEPELLVIA